MVVKESSIYQTANDLLEILEKDYQAKRSLIREFVAKYSKETSPRTILVVTSDLGHSQEYYVVETNADLISLNLIDVKYGMKYRHQSTTIEQMVEGAKDEGFVFTILKKRSSPVDKFPKDYVYHCNSGNY